MLMLREILGEEIDSLNRVYLSKIKSKLEKDNLSWILGAGVSVPAGMPQWDVLLMNMWGLLTEVNKKGSGKQATPPFEKTYDNLMEQLYQTPELREIYLKKFNENIHGKTKQYLNGVNVLEAAEYLWNIIEEQNPEHSLQRADMMVLKALIREALQLGMKDIPDSGSGELLLKEKLQNECIGIIAKILKRRGRGAAIVYNFDDLFEFCLEKVADIEEKDVWIGCDNQRYPGMQPIHVYHPHGKLCMFSKWEPRESETIVLTESSYYSMESKVYNWANSIQAKALVEQSCVFVGFSGTDYNFRRIIKNCHELKKGEEERHYIFIAVNSMVDRFFGEAVREKQREGISDENTALREVMRDPSYIFERVQMLNLCYAQTRYWGKYGIAPIWTTYEELPKLIQSLS